MRPCDSHECSQLNELKLDGAALNMLAGWSANGNIIMMEQMPIFGGYCGGVEETAICDTATHIASFAFLSANYHLDGPIHIRWGNTTSRETMQIATHTAAAMDQNTDLLLANQYYPVAGPCTEMCLIETATQAMADTASGRELLSGSAAAKGVAMDKTTGMEARIMGEAAKATAGMDIKEVNPIIEALVSGYEPNFAKAPSGKRFQDCYDVLSVKPKDEYLAVYDTVVQKLRDLGLDIRN